MWLPQDFIPNIDPVRWSGMKPLDCVIGIGAIGIKACVSGVFCLLLLESLVDKGHPLVRVREYVDAHGFRFRIGSLTSLSNSGSMG